MRSIIFPLKANHGRERDPVCVLAVNIAAVDQINVEVVDWTPGQPELEARIGYANGILPSAERSEVAKCLSVETGQTRSVNQSMSASGVKRTSACALHMSAFDPKRTLPDRSTTAFPVRLEPVRSTLAEL